MWWLHPTTYQSMTSWPYFATFLNYMQIHLYFSLVMFQWHHYIYIAVLEKQEILHFMIEQTSDIISCLFIYFSLWFGGVCNAKKQTIYDAFGYCLFYWKLKTIKKYFPNYCSHQKHCSFAYLICSCPMNSAIGTG